MAQTWTLADESLIDHLKAHPDERKDWLFLSPHSDFSGHWKVDSLASSFFFDLKDRVGPYRIVSPASLKDFQEEATSLGYKVAFLDDPWAILEPYERLGEEPEIELRSSMPNAIKGMLPFQVRGYNFLKDLDGGVALWSTGAGKTVLATALLLQHLKQDSFDLALIVCKSHNKINVQRALRTFGNLGSTVIEGDKKRRLRLYDEIAESTRGTIGILNYEKFRVDKDFIKELVTDRDLLYLWDEMPTRLKSRNTQVYRAVCECLYRTPPPAVDWNRKRSKSLCQYMFSATPIENDPEDFFNCVRLLDPRIFGTVTKFRDEFVARYSYFSPSTPAAWRNLDKLGLMVAHVVHEADKETDPEIKKQFPEAIEEPYYIDWDPKDRRIYDLLTKEAAALDLDEANVLALIGVMQMLCDAPSMVTNSAALRDAYETALEAWVESGGDHPTKEGSEAARKLVEALGAKVLGNERHTKLATLKELLTESHPNEKAVVFSAFNEGLLPIIEKKFEEWGVTYVRYNGTEKQKQEAQDKFKSDPAVQVFLSSDQGSDSLSLEEASICINYDLPWKWSTLIQRQNRIHRVVSQHGTVRYYHLLMADSVEDRKMEIIQRKLGYHEQVFKGAISDQAASARMTKADLIYVLTGA